MAFNLLFCGRSVAGLFPSAWKWLHHRAESRTCERGLIRSSSFPAAGQQPQNDEGALHDGEGGRGGAA